MVYPELIKVMPDDFGRRSPDFDPEGKYYTEDELEDMRADEADAWREEQFGK